MTSVFSDELTPASFACANRGLHSVFPTAMGVERRRAVRAGDPQILNPTVGGSSSDLIEDHCHTTSLPVFSFSAHLTDSCLEASLQQPSLELGARIVRPSD